MRPSTCLDYAANLAMNCFVILIFMEYFTKIVYIMNVCWSFVEQADIEGRSERLFNRRVNTSDRKFTLIKAAQTRVIGDVRRL